MTPFQKCHSTYRSGQKEMMEKDIIQPTMMLEHYINVK